MDVSKTSNVIHNILIADDEKLFLKSLRDGLRPFAKKHNFRILTAENGRKAMEVLEKEEVLVLITDIKMPEIDGLKLISHAMIHYPALPVVVMTAYGSPQINRIAKEYGVLRYLEKPIDFNEILRVILELLPRGKRRRIQGVTLPTFLQLLELEKSSCTLAVTNEDSRGFFFIRDGQLVEATAGELKGREAALAILDWNIMQIEVEDGCQLKEGSGMPSLTEVLLEAFRLKDEKALADATDELSIEIDESHGWEKPLEDSPPVKDVFELETPLPESSLASTVRLTRPVNMTIKISTSGVYKEVTMNIQKLNKAIESLRESLGSALISTDIFGSEDAQSIAGYNSQPAAAAVFTQITNYLNSSLRDAKFPEIGRYYLLDLVDRKMVLIIPMGDYIWGMLIDGTKTQLGLLLNLAIPKAISAFEEAIVD
jgi:YesN/AraC family two-component response regulator